MHAVAAIMACPPTFAAGPRFHTHVGGYTTSIFSTNAPEEALQPMRGENLHYEQKLTRGEEMLCGQCEPHMGSTVALKWLMSLGNHPGA